LRMLITELRFLRIVKRLTLIGSRLAFSLQSNQQQKIRQRRPAKAKLC
jgi:hypothetical protein